MDGKRIHVSKARRMDESIMGFDCALYKNKEKMLRKFSKIIDRLFMIRFLGSAVVELSAVAEGITAGHISFFTNPWDIGAGLILIREAGGKVTDFKGKDVNQYCGEFVASNGLIHNQILKCLK